MAIPSREKLKTSLLAFLKARGQATAQEAYKELAADLAVGPDDLGRRRASGQRLFEHEVRWAKQELVLDGLVHRPTRVGRNTWRAVSMLNADVFPKERRIGHHVEGALVSIQVNRYERSREARDDCFRAHGFHCSVCLFDFSVYYGEIGNGCIHVHHLVPLAEISATYEVDPVKDLRPVCPNCHYMIHRRDPPYSIDEIKTIVLRTRQASTRRE